MFQFYKNYMEFFFLLLMAVGIVIALMSPSAMISYAVIFLSGMFAGRVFYLRKSKLQLPYFMIITGFVIGYLFGVYYGSRIILIALFVLGALLGYKLYSKGILKDGTS